MFHLKWEVKAVDDLEAIINYISHNNPEAAQTLKNDIQTKSLRLQANPLLYRVGRVQGTREMVVRSNYIVVYAVDKQVVTILRVLHAARQWPQT